MRTYGETIEVRTGAAAVPDGDRSATFSVAPPAQFLWRGRLYLVREVLAHWVELGTWWNVRAPRTSRSVAPAGATPVDRAGPASSSDPVGPTGSGSAGSTGSTGSTGSAGSDVPRSVAADVGAVEREVWRVEAATGRTSRVGVYDLVRDVRAPDPRSPVPPPARWRLARALD
jgi:hypothetical protein